MTDVNKLGPTQQRFVLHWGEMGLRWGINRTVAQIHALLFLAPKPLNAEDIADTLQVARSNVSNSLKELQGWGIVKLVHVMGDKRDHFETLEDVWEMFRIVADERKRREIDPTRDVLRHCLESAPNELDAHSRERIAALSEFFESTSSWYTQARSWPKPLLIRFLKAGDRALKALGLGS